MASKTILGLALAAALFAQTPAFAADTAKDAAASLPSWESYVDQLRPIGERIIARHGFKTDQQKQEVYSLLFAALTEGYLDYVSSDPNYPDWMPAYDVALNLIAPVPDYRYKVTLIDPQGTYRISGYRGTSRFVDLTIFRSLISLGQKAPVAGKFSLDDLHLGPDGRYEVILSAKRPEGYTGDWYELDPKAIRLQVRHASYDWFHEIDARMAIERLDRPAARPRPTATEIADKLSKLATWTENTVEIGIKFVEEDRDKGIINRIEVKDYGAVGGFNQKVQTYIEGYFDIKDDEALIVETPIPETCRYWSILLADELSSTVDWQNRQSSLNGYQAKLDSDGKFRGVIAVKDPGVPNWLDTASHNQGIIQFRWNECSAQPVPTVTKVKLKDVRRRLPKDTPVVSAAERDAQLRVRREGAQYRRRW